jgi:NADH:ubiquinone oxidoreductase subunit 6 (subunit J)
METKSTRKIDKQYKASKALMWVASALLIVPAVYMIIWKTFNDIIAIAVVLGALIIIISFFSYIGMDKPADERLMKVGTMSATWSWYITLMFMCFLLFSGFYTPRQFQPAELFGLVIFVMVSSMLVLNTYFNRKGDVEETFHL